MHAFTHVSHDAGQQSVAGGNGEGDRSTGGGRSSCFLAKQEVQRRESRRKSGDYEKDKFI